MSRKGAILGLAVILAAVGLFRAAGIFGDGGGYDALKYYAVVQSRGASELALVDTRDDTLAGTLDLRSSPDMLVVSAAVERIVYATRADRTVTILDLADPDAPAIVSLGFAPDHIVLSPDGFTLAVAGSEAGAIALVSLVEQDVIGTIADLRDPVHMTFSGDSEQLFVSDSGASQLVVLDVTRARVLDPLPLDFGPADTARDLSALTRTPNGLFGLVVDRATDRIALVSFKRREQVDTLTLGRSPSRPYGTADGRFMLMANSADSTVSVVSTDYFQRQASLPGVSSVTGISTGFFETLAFVVSDTEERAMVLDLETMSLIQELDLRGTPGVPVSDADGRKIYVALSGRNAVLVYDAFNRKALKTIPEVGHSPWTVALAETNNYCH